MKIKIPKQIKVGGFLYRVILDGNLTVHTETSAAGITHHLRHTIRIDTSKERDQQDVEHTFIHELVHCIARHYLEEDLSERKVRGLSEGLYQVWKDM